MGSRSAMTPQELQQIEELKQLEENFNASDWLRNQSMEPLVGDSICPYLAEKYGMNRRSCYTVFVKKNIGNGTYGCRHERCRGFHADSLEDAITHQRYHHFDHRPFECIPLSGSQCGDRFYSFAELEEHQVNCP